MTVTESLGKDLFYGRCLERYQNRKPIHGVTAHWNEHNLKRKKSANDHKLAILVQIGRVFQYSWGDILVGHVAKPFYMF